MAGGGIFLGGPNYLKSLVPEPKTSLKCSLVGAVVCGTKLRSFEKKQNHFFEEAFGVINSHQCPPRQARPSYMEELPPSMRTRHQGSAIMM